MKYPKELFPNIHDQNYILDVDEGTIGVKKNNAFFIRRNKCCQMQKS